MKLYDDYTGPVYSERLVAARAQGRRIVHCPPPPGRTLDEDGVMFFVRVLYHDNERLAWYGLRPTTAKDAAGAVRPRSWMDDMADAGEALHLVERRRALGLPEIAGAGP